MKKIKIFACSFILSLNVIYSQRLKTFKDDLKFINNNIEYSIKLVSCKKEDGMTHTIIGKKIIVDLSNRQLGILNKLTSEQWMCLLKNEKTDWATNVILYFLSGKPALPYFNNERKRPKEWVKVFKMQDIKMWKEEICNPTQKMWTIPTCDDYIKLELQTQK